MTFKIWGSYISLNTGTKSCNHKIKIDNSSVTPKNSLTFVFFSFKPLEKS